MYYDFLYFLQQNMIIFSDYYTKIPKRNIWWTNANYKKMYIKELFYVQKLSCHRSVVLMPTQTCNQVWYLPYVTHCNFENKNYVIPLSYHHSEFSKCFFFISNLQLEWIFYIPSWLIILFFKRHWAVLFSVNNSVGCCLLFSDIVENFVVLQFQCGLMMTG